eukprot:g4833.t1
MMHQARANEPARANDKVSEKLDTVMMQNAQLLKRLDDGGVGFVPGKIPPQDTSARDRPMHDDHGAYAAHERVREDSSVPEKKHEARSGRRPGFLDPGTQTTSSHEAIKTEEMDEAESNFLDAFAGVETAANKEGKGKLETVDKLLSIINEDDSALNPASGDGKKADDASDAKKELERKNEMRARIMKQLGFMDIKKPRYRHLKENPGTEPLPGTILKGKSLFRAI